MRLGSLPFSSEGLHQEQKRLVALEIFEVETSIQSIRDLLRPSDFHRKRLRQLRVKARTEIKRVRREQALLAPVEMADFRSGENPRRDRVGGGERNLKRAVILPAVKIAGYGRFANKVEPNVELVRIDGRDSQYRRLTGIGIRLLAGGVVEFGSIAAKKKE